VTPVRTLLVDDSTLFLDAAAAFLAGDPAVELVGRAGSGHAALDEAARLRPDLVLMDWVMPGLDGLEATRRLKARSEAPRVILLTLYENPEYREAAAGAGADAFVAKADLGRHLLPLIHSLFADAEPRLACTG
jgi:DNA-binding NarL/FixJ family response regulator